MRRVNLLDQQVNAAHKFNLVGWVIKNLAICKVPYISFELLASLDNFGWIVIMRK